MESNNTLNYHFIEYHRMGGNSDTVVQQVRFGFSSEPTWFDFHFDGSISWMSGGGDTLFTENGNFTTDSLPAVYTIIISNKRITEIQTNY